MRDSADVIKRIRRKSQDNMIDSIEFRGKGPETIDGDDVHDDDVSNEQTKYFRSHKTGRFITFSHQEKIFFFCFAFKSRSRATSSIEA